VFPSKVYCQLCRTIHLEFKFENLHPLLRFLVNLEVCFRGRASTLTLKLTFQYIQNFRIEEDVRLRSRAKGTTAEMELLASQLHAVHHAIQRCGVGSDLVSSPACTRLVISDYEVAGHYLDLRNEDGVTLIETGVALAKRVESSYNIRVSHARRRVRQWNDDEDNMRLDPEYSQQSWDRKLRLRMETVSIYEEAGPRLHAIMQDFWRAPR
jgi:hypothetical protein